MTDSIKRFFNTLYAACLSAALYTLELRPVPASNDIRDFVPVVDGQIDLARVERFTQRTAEQKLAAYFGVALRAPGATTGRAEDCVLLPALFADFDFKYLGEDETRRRIAAFPLPPSITVNSGGGHHCYWRLQVPIDLRTDLPLAKSLLRRLAHGFAGVVDESVSEPTRILRIPGTFNTKKEYGTPRPVVLEHCCDDAYTVEMLEQVIPSETQTPGAMLLPAVILKGNRNPPLWTEACRLRRLGLDGDEIYAALAVVNQKRCHPPLPDDEVRAIAHRAAKYSAAPLAAAFPHTEAGNAEVFAAIYGEQVRHDHRHGRWLVRDETSGIWIPDPVERLTQMTVSMARERQQQATAIEDKKDRTAAWAWAMGSEGRSRINNTLAIARSVPGIADAGDTWDQEPFLLGVQNGVVDLQTGQFRTATAADRITMRVRVAYDPTAQCPLWLATLRSIFADSDPMIDFMQRALGYSITGDCREECAFFAWGGGSNGKGTVMNTLAWLFGDYADDMPYSTLERSDRGSGIPNDVAKLAGRRFITCGEVNEFNLNEARLKALTGRDPMTARFLNHEFFTFTPVCKIWIATNNRPKIVGQDDGIWRRIHLIPFTQSFKGRENKQLKDQLRLELPGILNWVIAGSMRWLADGLNPPDVVRDATSAYRHESNPVTPFVEECCVSNSQLRMQAGPAFAAYERFCRDENVEPWQRLSDKAFAKAMRQMFKVDQGRQTFYLGVGLRDMKLRDDPAESRVPF